MRPRHLLSWKPLFYDLALPLIARLDPAWGDKLLGRLGAALATFRPALRRRIRRSLDRAGRALGAGWDVEAEARALEANIPRHLARDYRLGPIDDAALFARFDVEGAEHLREALADGRGVVLVGSHLGAHVAGLHWLVRCGVGLRLMVQRPRHVSQLLRRWFDLDSAHPQGPMFLRRGLAPYACVERVLRARNALRDGLAVYFNGDVPWTGPNAREGTLLGRTQPFLSVWADLAVVTAAPVVFVLCTHAPSGRFTLSFSRPRRLAAGDEAAAVAAYFTQLDAAIALRPADAVVHLTWPGFESGGTGDDSVVTEPMTTPAPRGLKPPYSGGQRSPGSDPQPSLSRSVR